MEHTATQQAARHRRAGPKAWGRLATFALLLASVAPVRAAEGFDDFVVKVYATIQREDFTAPWQTTRPQRGTGSGFIIDKKRILTNAHVVSDARYLEVQKETDSHRFKAVVRYIAHDCDLAILSVDDPSFFEGTRPVRFAKSLPELDDEVTVVGYPMGGSRISITRGVVSRIDYNVYAHSGIDEHLVLQVDAAINPGNSGGPVMLRGAVTGLAFQGLRAGDNIGYAIPLPVIHRFLADIGDGAYDGYAEIGVAAFDADNPALRRDLALPDKTTGSAVFYVDPFGCAAGHIQPRDVLLGIDGHPIANDGTVTLNGRTVRYAELIERLQAGQAVTFTVWRNGARTDVRVPLENRSDPFTLRYEYGQRPRYVTVGGLVFSPLSRGYLGAVGRQIGDRNVQQLVYFSQYAKIDGLYQGHDEFVVLIRRLPHAVNSYAGDFLNGILNTVNGVTITKLADVRKALAENKDAFHVFTFLGTEEKLILDAAAARDAEAAILAGYGLPGPDFLGDTQ